MVDRAFEPKQGRIRDSGRRTNLTTARRVLTQAGRAGAGIVRQRGHIAPDARRRGTAAGLFARAGIMAPGSRRVIVRARYSRQVAGDLGAATAHLCRQVAGRTLRLPKRVNAREHTRCGSGIPVSDLSPLEPCTKGCQ